MCNEIHLQILFLKLSLGSSSINLFFLFFFYAQKIINQSLINSKRPEKWQNNLKKKSEKNKSRWDGWGGTGYVVGGAIFLPTLKTQIGVKEMRISDRFFFPWIRLILHG